MLLPADPGYVASISREDQNSLERRVNFSELINPGSGPVDTTNVSLYEALKSVIEWTGQVRVSMVIGEARRAGVPRVYPPPPPHETVV